MSFPKLSAADARGFRDRVKEQPQDSFWEQIRTAATKGESSVVIFPNSDTVRGKWTLELINEGFTVDPAKGIRHPYALLVSW